MVCVAAPTGQDGRLIVEVLTRGGLLARVVTDLPMLEDLNGQDVGALLVAEEALTEAFIDGLDAMLKRQAAWSDLPVLVLTSGRDKASTTAVERWHRVLGSPVLLERPIRTANLMSSLQAAIRGRKRQFEMRDTLDARDQALADLRQERETLQVVLDNLPVGVLLAKRSGEIVLGNKATERIFRHPILDTPDVEAHGAWVAYHADGSRVRGQEFPLPRAMASGAPIQPEDFLYQRGDGSKAWISLAAAPIFGEHGEVTGGVVAISDIDQQKRVASDLFRSNERFWRLIENASVGLIIGDFDGGISYANPAILQLLGYTAEEVKSLPVNWRELTPPEYEAADEKAIQELSSRGKAESYQKMYRAKGGQLIPLLIGATMIPSQQHGHDSDQVAVFITDLSSQKKAESALVQSEKLAAVGRLAASISHEINNPLEAVTNLLYLARISPETPESVQTLLKTADQELQRVSQIAAQTLRFHRQATKARSIHLEELLDPTLTLYKGRLMNAQITVELEHRGAAPITCFEGDIRQVLNNLIGNAIDSMRSGGRLVIRTSKAWIHKEQQPAVRISIADTGHGMSREVMRNIYEPFYTTKGINGSGLGLWISRGIVEKHSGRLRVRSRLGEPSGTVFSLFLPLSGALPEVLHATGIDGA